MDTHIITLFQKYINQQCTPKEFEEVFAILKNGLYQSEWQKVIDDEAEEVLSSGKQSELSEQEVNHIYIGIAAKLPSGRQVYKLWPRIAVAASVAIAVMVGGYFYYNSHKQPLETIAHQNDIAPGHNGATLTLASGQKIRLTDAANGQLAKESGVTITKTASGQLIYEIRDENTASNKINVLTTDNGETYQVRLPDGSSVWLNAASILKYPASFAKLKERRVELSGEGYFEVVKDNAHPFIVKTADQEVRVLGTHFNINAYPDESVTATTLLEGSVKLISGDSGQLLKPGEQAVNDEGEIKVGKANIEAIVDWKNEEFFLDKMDFRVAMRKIARWYDIQVIYNGSVPVNLKSGGWIPRNSKLSDVLKSIESTGQVHFKIEGRKLYVSK